MKELGKRIKSARLAAGMTQTQLARSIETSDRNVQRWESDDNEPRTTQLAKIAEATGKTLDFFLAAEVQEPSATFPSRAA